MAIFFIFHESLLKSHRQFTELNLFATRRKKIVHYICE